MPLAALTIWLGVSEYLPVIPALLQVATRRHSKAHGPRARFRSTRHAEGPAQNLPLVGYTLECMHRVIAEMIPDPPVRSLASGIAGALETDEQRTSVLVHAQLFHTDAVLENSFDLVL